jgi:hypothetical protein
MAVDVLNLQLKAKTIKALAIPSRSFTQGTFFDAYIKWFTHFKTNLPNDNANVNIDSIPMIMVAALYDITLFDIKYKTILDDFQTSLISKRNIDSVLDDLCSASEDKLTQMIADNILEGNKLLSGVL